MKIVVDANILFACLLRESATRRAWFYPELQLYAPEFILVELKKYRGLLEKKFGGNSKDFEYLLKKIARQIIFIPDSELKPFLPAAQTLSTDLKDAYYFACALYIGGMIWSNDKEFTEQNRITVKKTHELINEYGRI